MSKKIRFQISKGLLTVYRKANFVEEDLLCFAGFLSKDCVLQRRLRTHQSQLPGPSVFFSST